MIAPDPALAGPRPAARPDPAKTGEPRARGDHRRDGDFELALATPNGRKPEQRREAAGGHSPQRPAASAADPANAGEPLARGNRRRDGDREAVLSMPIKGQPEHRDENPAAEAPADPAAIAASTVDAATAAGAVAAGPAPAASDPTPASADPVATRAPVELAIGARQIVSDRKIPTDTRGEPRKDALVERAAAVAENPRAQRLTASFEAVPGSPKPAAAQIPIKPPAPGGIQAQARKVAAQEPKDGDRPAPPPTPAVSTTPAPTPQPAASAGPVQAHALVSSDAAPPQWHLTPSPVAGPARTDAPVPTPVQVSPQVVVGQLAFAVGQTHDRRVEIRLDPPELGRVQIHLKPIDGGVQAVVLADRPETQDLLRRHADQLARELGEAGYGSVSLDFAAGGDTEPHRESAPLSAMLATAPSATDAVQPAAAALRPNAMTGGLDIRL